MQSERAGQGEQIHQPQADASLLPDQKKENVPKMVFQVGQRWEQPTEQGSNLTIEKNNSGIFQVRVKVDDHPLYGTKLNMHKSELDKVLRDGSYERVSQRSRADHQRESINGSGDVITQAETITNLTEKGVAEQNNKEGAGTASAEDASHQLDVEHNTPAQMLDTMDNAMIQTLDTIVIPTNEKIVRILEQNRVALRDDYIILFDEQEKITRSINMMYRRNDVLYDDIEQTGGEVTAEHVTKKKQLMTELETLTQALLTFAKEVEASLTAMNKSDTTLMSENESPSTREHTLTEQHSQALQMFVSQVWQQLQTLMSNQTTRIGDRNRIWEQQFLPALKEEMRHFLRKQPELSEDEYESTITTFFTKKGLLIKKILPALKESV